MPSTTRWTPRSLQAAPRRGRSSLRPSWKRTQDRARTRVRGSKASMSRPSGSDSARGGSLAQAAAPARCPSQSGTSRNLTPRGRRASQGQAFEGNSPRGARTSSPRCQGIPWARVTRPEEVVGVRLMSSARPPTRSAASLRTATGMPWKSSSQRTSQGWSSFCMKARATLMPARGTGPSAQCMTQRWSGSRWKSAGLRGGVLIPCRRPAAPSGPRDRWVPPGRGPRRRTAGSPTGRGCRPAGG